MEIKNSQEIPSLWKSKIIGKLQLVFMLRDKYAGEEVGFAYIFKDIGAIVKLLQWKSVNCIHSMVEIQPWLITIGKSIRFLIGQKIYSLTYSIRKAHVITVILR